MKGRMAEFGLEVREDTVGNLFGVLRGTDPEAPSIISGSHLDSVKCSGAFDGIAGVVCALEAARIDVYKRQLPDGLWLRHGVGIAAVCGDYHNPAVQILRDMGIQPG